METVIRGESPTEYFKGLLDDALEHQHVDAGDLTRYYLVNLLAGFASGVTSAGTSSDQPLGIQLLHALRGGGVRKTRQLKHVGDQSLFISGFFCDSLRRSLADVDYYIDLGAWAYRLLGDEADRTIAPVFVELAARFSAFVDLLAEISERTALTSNNDLLRLYEKWLRTGSARNGRLLAERGIVPNASIGNRFVQ